MLFVDPAVWGREGLDCEEPSASSDNSPCPKRVGQGGVTVGDYGEGRGVLQLGGKQVSSVLELGPFAVILAQNCPESGPFFPSATSLDTFHPKLYKCLYPGLTSPILSAEDLMSILC